MAADLLNQMAIALGRAQDAADHGWLVDGDLRVARAAIRRARVVDPYHDEVLAAEAWYADLWRAFTTESARVAAIWI